MVRKGDDANTIFLSTTARHPIQHVVQRIHRTNTGKGKIDNVTALEGFRTISISVLLLQHVHDVGGGGFRAIECGLSAQIYTPDPTRID